VANVEHADGFAHGEVLIVHAGILHGHEKAGEGHHFGTEGFMDVGQLDFFRRIGFGHFLRCSISSLKKPT
jgi:hypothetical protein